MIKLLIIADDLTGALDTGAQFSEQGISTSVRIGTELRDLDLHNKEIDVLIIDTESRHLHCHQAYKIVFDIAKKAIDNNISYIFKKTDSALRGCVGSELLALNEASSETVHFIPAYPQVNRKTINGIQYIDGIPVSDSVFGKDPFEPLRTSFIPQIMDVDNVTLCKVGEVCKKNDTNILVYDAETEEDLKKNVSMLKDNGLIKCLAGCAGLASVLPDYLDLNRCHNFNYKKTNNIFVVSGSLNPITSQQIREAVDYGFTEIRLNEKQKLDPCFWENQGDEFVESLKKACSGNKPVLVDVDPETFNLNEDNQAKNRIQIAKRLGEIINKWIEFKLPHTLVVIGGDTLIGFISQIEYSYFRPICTISQGTVISEIKLKNQTLQLISKSGGLGEKEVLIKLYEKLNNERNGERKDEKNTRNYYTNHNAYE